MNIEKDDYYTREELSNMNFLHLGEGVKISRRTGIYVPEKVWIGNYVTIEAFTKISPNVYLRDYVTISPFCALHGDKGIYLEEHVTLLSHVCMYSSTSDYSGYYMATAMVHGGEYVGDLGGSIVIGRNTKIFSNCCILPGAYVREDSEILERTLVRSKG